MSPLEYAFIVVSAILMAIAQADWSQQPDRSILFSGSSMKPGDTRISDSETYMLTFDGDIHLMQWTVDESHPKGWFGVFIWSICSGQSGSSFTMRYDGNLVLADASGKWLWSHDQNLAGSDSSPYYVMVGNAGHLTEFSNDGFMVWNSSDPKAQNSGTQLAKVKYGDCLTV